MTDRVKQSAHPPTSHPWEATVEHLPAVEMMLPVAPGAPDSLVSSPAQVRALVEVLEQAADDETRLRIINSEIAASDRYRKWLHDNRRGIVRRMYEAPGRYTLVAIARAADVSDALISRWAVDWGAAPRRGRKQRAT